MSSYHIAKNGQQSGPYDEDHIRRQITEGRLAATDLCWCEGMAAWQPISDVFNMQSVIVAPPPIPEHGTNAKETNSPLFLYIPVSRLIILSIVSMSLYEAYWVYKNWRYIKERDGLDIRPFWRGWFGVFFCHSLLRRIHEDGQARACVQPSFCKRLTNRMSAGRRGPGQPATRSDAWRTHRSGMSDEIWPVVNSGRRCITSSR